MTNAMRLINELRNERNALIENAQKECVERLNDVTAFLFSDNFSEEYKARINEIETQIAELRKSNPYEAAYYDGVKKVIGYFDTENNAKSALEKFKNNGMICVINDEEF